MRASTIANDDCNTILIVDITPLKTSRGVKVDLFDWVWWLFYALTITKFVAIATAILRTDDFYLLSRNVELADNTRYELHTIYKYM